MQPETVTKPRRRRTAAHAASPPPPIRTERPAPDGPLTDVENNAWNLFRIARKALFWPPWYITSIFGPPYTWPIPHRKYSELTIVDLWRPLRLLRFARDLCVPAFTEEPPDLIRTFFPPAVNAYVWRPSAFFQQPDPYAGVTSFPGERWFYINGVATNADVAGLNAAFLSHLFHRPLTAIHNATASLPFDLWECAMGKEFKTKPRLDQRGTMTEPALKATHAVLSAIMEPAVDRVVVLAHSQGTIITANVLRALHWALDQKEKVQTTRLREGTYPDAVRALLDDVVGAATNEPLQQLRDRLGHEIVRFCRHAQTATTHPLKKLEVYTFANCADRMKYVSDEGPYPWLEHFGNEYDLVARLGVLSPCRTGDEGALVDIDGPVYERKGAWGHFLNEHYLYGIYDYLSPRGPACVNPYAARAPHRDGAPPTPRLYGYFEGGRPAREERGDRRQEAEERS